MSEWAAAIEALDRDLLHLVYQPIMDIESGEVVYHDAFNQIDYALQRARLIAVVPASAQPP